ncbi:receptor-like protein kinase FERONIA [Cannabis sativa]|uniref:receptor-like protein kinase FERONIA n=1 Tax=Cannabis sativa TaxID=3483 RepID=UPI0029C9D28E|nr:receptor-like protein kinase FERONIA [Cannabis sativa]
MKNLPVVIITPSYLFILFFYHISTVNSSTTPAYIPVDNIALDCGASTEDDTAAPDGRIWIAEEPSKFAQTQANTNSSYVSVAKSQPNSGKKVPYFTARIFRSQFTYTFPLKESGPKFVRLHFYSAQYTDFDASKAYFDVKAGSSFTLLKNFSASLVAESLNQDSFMREFCVYVVEPNKTLSLTFIPSSSSNNYSYAFVNGIEIVSMPKDLYYYDSIDQPKYVGLMNNNQIFRINDNLALETIGRINMGGRSIPGRDDTGMYRQWSDVGRTTFLTRNKTHVTDHKPFVTTNYTKPLKYSELIRNYTAPDEVYQSALFMTNNSTYNSLHNLTSILPVDRGFKYLVRLHFCEFQEEITRPNDRSFSIYVANNVAESFFDVISSSGGNGIPFYRDYVVNIQDQDSISIDLVPLERLSRYTNTILNGVEVLKISNHGNLAGPNPEVLGIANPSSGTEKKRQKKTAVFIAIGSGMGLLTIILCIVCWVVLWRVKKRRPYRDFHKGKSNKFSKASSLPEEICRRFSLSEIKTATNDFDDELVIGRGGFGNVFRGIIDDESTVAVKRLNPDSRQGAREFVTEIEMLSQLRHVHLVSLIGYCDDGGEMILVYEYVANGTLRDHIYGSNNDPLPWKQRLEICVGAARGLHYLHAGVTNTIIHRDVKTTNILLDDNWVAKVSDFGLSRIGVTDTVVNTLVKGTFGYLDPEYARNNQLTDKSDVYSFGVVLFEVLCARKAVDVKLEDDQRNLVYWAQKCISEGTLQNIIDPFLMGKIAPECFKKFVEVAQSCVREQRIQRPKMHDVMENLEFALTLQEQADNVNEERNPGGLYSYPQLSFHASDRNVARYDDMSGLQSTTDLTSFGSNTTGLSFPTVETESNNAANMFSESATSRSTQ